MKRIKLTGNKFALVDDQDFELLNQWKWYAHKDGNTYYAIRGVWKDNKVFRFFMHREILDLKYKDGKITDHINRNGLDNRKTNLRIVTKAENCRNHTKFSTNTSGYTGVSWHKVIKKWQSQIRAGGKKINLGYYNNIKDAVGARKQGEIRYWGENRI